MIVINYNRAFHALKVHIEAYNNTVEGLSEKIRQGTASTAKDIIRIYGLFTLKLKSEKDFDVAKLPMLRTNNVQLAKLGNTSPRTIQRHIKRLIKAGIITQKVWHGSNSSYELGINTSILLITRSKPKKEIEQELKSSLKASHENDLSIMDAEEHKTNCPHTESGYNSYTSTNLLIGVENSSNEERCEPSLTSYDDSGHNISGHTLSRHTGEKALKKMQGAGEKVQHVKSDQKDRELTALEVDPARAASLSLYASLLWRAAKTLLYRDVFLTERQEEIALKMLKKWYEPVSSRALSNVHQVYIERIGLVRKYIEKSPETRFVQLPYAYFDPENLSGFAGTKKWWEAHRIQQIEVKKKLILHAQIRRYINNEKREESKKKEPLALYLSCEQRVGKLGDPTLLEAFHAAVLSPTTNQALYAI